MKLLHYLPIASALLAATATLAQTTATIAPAAATAATVVPTLVPYTGSALNGDGKALAGEKDATFLLFKDEEGGEPLWSESQMVAIDAAGHYQVQLGASSPSGLPITTFAFGEARWLEVQIAGEKPRPRTLLVSVPYAMKAADAATLGGLPASAFALAGSTSTPLAATAGTPDASSSTVTTPGGTAGYLPVFSGTTTIDDSILYESSTTIGIGTKTPASTLDVNGAITARGALTMESTGAATSTAGKNSQPIDFLASAYNSSTKKAVAPVFTLQSEAASNDTSAPGATLNLLYGNGTTPAETGLAISNKGIIKFATGQTFAGANGGTITGVTTSSPLTGSGTTGSVALGLNLSSLETSLNSKYAQLGTANKFTGLITFATGQTFPGSGTITGITAGTDLIGGGTTGTVKLSLDTTKIPTLTGSPVFNGSAGDGAVGDTAGTTLNTAGVVGVAGTGNTSGFGGIAGVWGNATAHVGVLGTSDQYAGVQGISKSGSGVQGVSTSGIGVQASSTSNTAVAGTSTSGAGVSGSSTSSAGMIGYTAGSTLNTAGTFGIAGARTSFSGIAGIWGDAAAHVGVFGSSNQYPGVQGSSVSGQGVQGNSTSGNGVHGVSQSTSGIFGETSSTSSSDAALYGYSHAGAAGVYGFSATSNGVHGVSTNASGLLAETSSASQSDAAVYAASYGNAAGVYGVGPNVGIYGVSGGPSYTGMLPFSFENGPPGVWGDTNGSGYGVAGTAYNAVAGEFNNDSETIPALEVNNFYGIVGEPFEGPVASIFGGTGGCTFFANGDVTCTGAVSSDNDVDHGARAVTTYSVQSAESWYEDAGSALLVNGVAHVSLDPTFGQTVNTNIEYHVFLTPGGDSDGLYVSNKTAQGFDVHEQHGGHSSIAFDYRIMAKRAGHENERLADVTERVKKQEMRMHQRATQSALHASPASMTSPGKAQDADKTFAAKN